jgi:outer membrane autotransporter protein
VFNTGTIIGTNSAGVYIAGGGSVNNRCGGTITGLGDDGVEIEGGVGSVVNHGTITGAGSDGYGVYLVSGGSVSNLCRGIILGNQYGVYIKNSSGTGVVYNAGTIIGTNNDGVHIGGGGSVYNSWHGTISGGSNGVSILDGVGSVVNHGTIIGAGPVGEGVYLANGGSVDNLCRGIIQGNNNGVYILNSGGTGSVVNAGKIIGTNNDGVYISGGGSVDNQRWGTIKGPFGVAIVGGAASVTNAGKIIGTSGTAISLDNYNNTVVLKTGSCVQGDIVGGTDTDAAILQGHGWYGNSFLNFETLTVQASGCRGWNLTGTNIFTTGATVETGLLRINGELDTQLLTVSNSAGLGGAGTIVGIVDNHGYFKPGNSIGTLTIIGSMTNWGDYNVQVDNAGNSDRILVSDTATINSGWVYAQPAHEVYGTNTVYTILTATNGVTGYGVTGSYDGSSITPLFPSWLGFVSSLSNDLNNVYLTLHRDPFVSVANTYNQRGVAGALDGIVTSPGPGMSNLVSEFFWLPSATAARAALDSMSGEIHGTLGMLDMQQQDAFNRSVSQRTGRISAGGESGGYASAKPVQLADASSTLPPMQPAQASQSWDVWLQGFGSFGHLDGDGNALGGTFNNSGLNGGLDYRLRPEMLIGLALGYSYDDASVGGPGEDGNVSAFQIAGYGGYVNGPWHLDGIFSYGFLSTDTKRYINVGSIHQEAKASYDGGVLSLSGEGGYAFEAGRFTIEPTLGLDYTHLSQDSFNETGIATDGHNYGLNVHSVDMDSFRTALGARLSAQFGRTNGVQFIPELRAGWEHEFMDKTADVTARFIGGSGDFIVRGVELGADSAALGAGLTVAFNKAIQASVNYDARLNERLTSQAISGRLSFSW